jgi:hypothetical protein
MMLRHYFILILITGIKSRTSSRNLFMSLEILPRPCEYIFTLMKVKLSLCLTKHHTMKAYWGSGGIAPRIL